MTRKDYILIADCIKHYLVTYSAQDEKTYKDSNIVSTFAEILDRNCSNFNRETFVNYIQNK